MGSRIACLPQHLYYLRLLHHVFRQWISGAMPTLRPSRNRVDGLADFKVLDPQDHAEGFGDSYFCGCFGACPGLVNFAHEVDSLNPRQAEIDTQSKIHAHGPSSLVWLQWMGMQQYVTYTCASTGCRSQVRLQACGFEHHCASAVDGIRPHHQGSTGTRVLEVLVEALPRH